MATVLETIGSREAESPWLSRVDKPAELTVPAEAVAVRNPAWPLASMILTSVIFVALLLALTLYVVLAVAISRLVNIRRVNAPGGRSPVS
jgi:hypothetical protein